MRSTHDSNLENKRFIFLSCKERRGEQEGGCRNEMESEGSSKKEKKYIHTSHFLLSIISSKPDNSKSNLSEHVSVCVCYSEAGEASGCEGWAHLRAL